MRIPNGYDEDGDIYVVSVFHQLHCLVSPTFLCPSPARLEEKLRNAFSVYDAEVFRESDGGCITDTDNGSPSYLPLRRTSTSSAKMRCRSNLGYYQPKFERPRNKRMEWNTCMQGLRQALQMDGGPSL